MSNITKVTPEAAKSIIETRKPLGQFYTKENDLYTAIDNDHGDAWTEDFKSLASAKKYLRGERVKDAYGNWLNS